ncbi:MAG: SAM-dependent chlorinase/fluorinase [Nitrospirae bacterium]|nr:SAM-dependent chlorinase/fluorinase [Nitrospirota bacterium]
MDLPKNIIALTTDFGTSDYFVGSIKGVMLGINPNAKIIDVTHDIPSHDIWSAAYILGMTYKYFPQYSIHLAVADPGVGSARRAIMAITDKQYFLAPDNGLLSFIFEDPDFSRVIHINAEHYYLPVVGSTFHARDIFAPVAGWLSKGVEPEKMGDEITDYVRFAVPKPKKEGETVLSGEVVYIDKFGNCITNLHFEDIRTMAESTGSGSYSIAFKETAVDKLSPFYASVKKGEHGIVVNGNGYLEIFVNQSDARRVLALKRGEKIRITF